MDHALPLQEFPVNVIDTRTGTVIPRTIRATNVVDALAVFEALKAIVERANKN